MASLNEKQRVKKLIKLYRNRYPKAVANNKDKNLLGEFLETMARQALTNAGMKVVDWAATAGDRGIDATVMRDDFFRPLFLAIECMNGRFDYTEKYFEYLESRIARECSEQHYPVIICVNQKKNFQRFKGSFACKVRIVELGKQYHPNTITYKDYLQLKKLLKDTVIQIDKEERPEEMAEHKLKKQEEEELEEEKKALEALDEKRLEETENFDETPDEEEGRNLWQG